MNSPNSWNGLVAELAADGVLTTEREPVFRDLPRTGFLPDVMWQNDVATGDVVLVDRARDPQRWRAAAESGDPLVTQWDDGEHQGPEPGQVAS